MLVEKTADEIRADKQAWLDRKARNKEKSDQMWAKYREDERAILLPIKNTIESILSKFNLLSFDVRVEFNYGSLAEVRVRCNEDKKFSEDSALSWDYSALFNPKTGEVKKESGSWSGLKATTSAQLDSLRQTVEALEALNSVNYSELLNVKALNYDDYSYEQEDETPEYDYDTELASQQIRELIGKGKAIRIKNFNGDRRGASDLFLVPLKETPKKIEGRVFSARYVDNGVDPKEIYKSYPQPIMKSKITIVEPIEIVDVE